MKKSIRFIMLCKPVGGPVVVDSLFYCYSYCLGFYARSLFCYAVHCVYCELVSLLSLSS